MIHGRPPEGRDAGEARLAGDVDEAEMGSGSGGIPVREAQSDDEGCGQGGSSDAAARPRVGHDRPTA